MGTLHRADLEARVAEDRAELRRAVGDLGERARDAADPRQWVRERPLRWLTLAVVAGLALGFRHAERRSKR